MPLSFFLIGAALAVALSFAIIGFFVRTDAGSMSYPRIDLFQCPWFRKSVTSPFFRWPFKLLAVFLLGLVIAAGLAGSQVPSSNFAPTFVWIIWWVGMAFIASLAGNLWELVNPWKALFEIGEAFNHVLRRGRSLSLNLPYPEGWGMWPAVLLFLGFTWIQDAFPQSAVPNRVAWLAIGYTLVTLSGMAIFGKRQWLRQGEAFSVIFGFLAKFAPTEVRVGEPYLCRDCQDQCIDEGGECINCYECFEKASSPEWNLRPFAAGLSNRERMSNDKLAVVVLLLATVTFDGFSATSGWVDFQTAVVNALSGSINYAAFNSRTVADTLGVLLFPVLFFLTFLTFTRFMAGVVGADHDPWHLARSFAYSLIPIALAYNIAHYITLLLIQGQLLVPLVSDPFGFGWDLLGTAGYSVDIGIINARVLWYLSTALIVVGHILAVYLAHIVSFRVFSGRGEALTSQYPMLTLMVMYTVISLWIIAQPIVE